MEIESNFSPLFFQMYKIVQRIAYEYNTVPMQDRMPTNKMEYVIKKIMRLQEIYMENNGDI